MVQSLILSGPSGQVNRGLQALSVSTKTGMKSLAYMEMLASSILSLGP